jgi:uncharacterized phage protein gp47/JayE
MSYAAPTVTSAGLTVSGYSDTIAYFKQALQNIYGQNEYLEDDSVLYQMASLFALCTSDTAAGLQLLYNNRSPLTAIGSGLDPLGVLCGDVIRGTGSYSTAPMTLTGKTGKTITSTELEDQNGNIWYIPDGLAIGSAGTASTTATANDVGAVTAAKDTITIVVKPQDGLTSVTNTADATPGTSIETDSEYRARMVISQALPGITMLASTQAALESVSGVTRANVVENDTGSVDSYGNPAHSISCVVEGGAVVDVATAIWTYKGVGAYTNNATNGTDNPGATSYVVTDPNTADTTTIRFSYVTDIPISVVMTIKALNGYTTSTTAAIRTALVSYLNSLDIGQDVTISSLYATALSVLESLSSPTFSVTACSAGSLAATTTGSPVIGTNTVTVASATGIVTGQYIVDGTNSAAFVSGTTVTNVSGTTVTLSNNATASYTSDALNFFTVGTTDIAMNYYDVAEGLAANIVLVVS